MTCSRSAGSVTSVRVTGSRRRPWENSPRPAARTLRAQLRIVGLLREAGPLSAGRLTAAGCVTRTTDARDRRRAVVALTTMAADLFGQIYDPILQAGLTELARYSATEIALVTEVLRRGQRMQLVQAERIASLRSDATGPARTES